MDALETPVAAAPAPDTEARDKLVIGLLLVSTFVVFLNETIMGVAIPQLMTALQIRASDAQWLTTAFLLTMAVVIPTTGFMLQRLTTRQAYMLAMALFSLGTLICALAPGLVVLVGGRVVQALGTAIMMPLLMTTIMDLVPAERRGKTMGDISIVLSVAPALGPTIAGLVLGWLTWRWLFWLVLPIALFALVLGHVKLPNVNEVKDARLDLASIPLAAAGFGGVVYGLSQLGVGGGPTAWGALGVGAVALAAFLARQRFLEREDRALLDLRTLGHYDFAVAAGMLAIAMMALFGTFILLPIYLQTVRGLDSLQTGLLLLPGGLLMGLLSPPVGKIYDQRGPKPLVVPGALLVAGVTWGFTWLTATTHVGWLLAAHLVLSVGLALVFTPVFTAGLGALPKALYAHGSAVVGTVEQLAGAVGAALLVAIMTWRTDSLLAAGTAPVDAAVAGIQAAFLAGAILATLMVVAGAFIRKPPEPEPEGEPA